MKTYSKPIPSVLRNLLLILLLSAACRVLYYLVNIHTFAELSFWDVVKLCLAGIRFDISAGLYHNIPYLVLALLPFAFRFTDKYQKFLKWVFIIPNAFWIVCNIADSVYFTYTSRRSTVSLFTELDGESNFPEIAANEIRLHWWVALACIVILYLLCKLYRRQKCASKVFNANDFLKHSAIFALTALLCVVGIRGTLNPAGHPINVKTANRYVSRPIESTIVLNTQFTFYHSLLSEPYEKVEYFDDNDRMTEIFNSLHEPALAAPGSGKNVVILLLESFSASYSGYLSELQGNPAKGYMPFLDSLMHESLIFRNSYTTGRKSIEALAAVNTAIPAFGEPVFLTKYFDDDMEGIAAQLAAEGYKTAFWHGACATSLNITNINLKVGYQRHYSREDFGNEAEFDGIWAVWDEPFIEYFKSGIDTLQQPFLASIFTATSHHPFRIPAKYNGVFDEGTLPMHKCVGYTDHALREFFAAASKEPWYNNTVFVISGDHTNITDRPEYLTDNGLFEVPIIFYTPDGSLKGLREGVASQTDIMPTLLGYIGCKRPYVAFGQDLLSTPDEDTFAVSYISGCYQLVKPAEGRLWLLQHDGIETVGLYDLDADPMMKQNLVDEESAAGIEQMMTDNLMAVVQQYMERIIDDRLVAGN